MIGMRIFKRWTNSEAWFADKVTKEGYVHALVTTNKVKPDTIPGDHVSIVVNDQRRWGFKSSSERTMAERIAGGEVR